MKKVVVNPIELRDAIRCEKQNISITGGFAKMMQELVNEQPHATDQLLENKLPIFMKLALDPRTVEKLTTTYRLALKNDSADFELEYEKI